MVGYANSQEMLDQLLRDGKIGDDDYVRLSKALRHEEAVMQAPASSRPSELGPPWQVWPAIVACTISSLSALVVLGRNPLLCLLIIVVNTLLSVGLYYKNKWVYVAALFFCFISVITIASMPIAAISNIIIGLILLSAYQDFFVPQSGPNPARLAVRWSAIKAEPNILLRAFGFGLVSFVFLVIAPVQLSKLLFRRVIDVYSQLGVELPFLGKIMLAISNAYMRNALFALLIVIGASLVYLWLEGRARKTYATIFVVLSVVWSLLIALGILAVMYHLPAGPIR